MDRALLSQSIICYIADGLIDFTFNWPFVTQDTRHERGTGISSIQFCLLLNHLIYDWLTGRKRIAEADATVMPITSALLMQTPGQRSLSPSWQKEDLAMSRFGRVKPSCSHHFPQKRTDPSCLPRPAKMPAQQDFLFALHFSISLKKIIILTLSRTFSNLFPIINERRMADIPSTDQHHKPY